MICLARRGVLRVHVFHARQRGGPAPVRCGCAGRRPANADARAFFAFDRR